MRHAIAAVLVSFVALLLVACSSTPQYTHCNYGAKRVIKSYLANPSTFDEHGLLTIRRVKHLSHIFPWGTEGEYILDTGIIFGAKNSFGVSQDYIAWFSAKVDTDGDCYDINVDGTSIPLMSDGYLYRIGEYGIITQNGGATMATIEERVTKLGIL